MREETPLPEARESLVRGPATSTLGRATPEQALGPRTGSLVLARHALLWLVLATISTLVLLVPDTLVGDRNPLLAVAMAAIMGMVGLALLQLGLVRFLVFGRPVDLFAGLAFGILAVNQLLVGVYGAVFAVSELSGPTVTHLTLLARAVAASLFVAGLSSTGRHVQSAVRSEAAWRLGVGVTLLLLVVGLAFLSADARLPDVVDPRARDLLARGEPVLGALPGQSLPLLIATGLIALLLLVAAVGHVALSRRLADAQVGWLAAALALLFFAELHAFLVPPLATDYVGTGDGFRVGAYLLLLFSLVSRLAGEITERASDEERLRLSRELHDGLAQQLGLLNLRLSRAAAVGRPSEARSRDLEMAKRLVEVALLEARQVITALRTGEVSWDEFTRTLATFADEFSENHEVEVRLLTEGQVPTIRAEMQAEVLRILQETFSNAVRHGHTARVDVQVVAAPGRLELSIHDDGRGFDPGTAFGGAGMGLRSVSERLDRWGGTLQLQSAPGQGATVRARLSLLSGW